MPGRIRNGKFGRLTMTVKRDGHNMPSHRHHKETKLYQDLKDPKLRNTRLKSFPRA